VNLVNRLLPKLEKLESRRALLGRGLTLNESFDDAGRLIQMLGTNVVQSTAPDGTLQFGLSYHAESDGSCASWDYRSLADLQYHW